jgi:hypothetical protein
MSGTTEDRTGHFPLYEAKSAIFINSRSGGGAARKSEFPPQWTASFAMPQLDSTHCPRFGKSWGQLDPALVAKPQAGNFIWELGLLQAAFPAPYTSPCRNRATTAHNVLPPSVVRSTLNAIGCAVCPTQLWNRPSTDVE